MRNTSLLPDGCIFYPVTPKAEQIAPLPEVKV